MTSQEKGERAALCGGRISDVSERASEHGGREEGGAGMDGWKGMMARNRNRMLLFFLFICSLSTFAISKNTYKQNIKQLPVKAQINRLRCRDSRSLTDGIGGE